MPLRRLPILLAIALALAAGLPATAQTTLPPGGTFFDDDGNIHEAAIEAIAAAGITSGCTTDLFCPARAVTRAEMAAFLIRALDESEAPAAGTFPDVPAGQWYTGYVERLAALEISVGYADGNFRPHSPVSRGEMAVFLIRALNLPELPPQGTFADVPASAFFAGEVEQLAAREVTLGCGNGLYCPYDQVLRDQMATFVTRALGLTPIQPPPANGEHWTVMLRGVVENGDNRFWWDAKYLRSLPYGLVTSWVDGDRSGYRCLYGFLTLDGVPVGRVTFMRVEGAADYGIVNDSKMEEGARYYDGTLAPPGAPKELGQCPSPNVAYEPWSGPDERPTILYSTPSGQLLEVRNYKTLSAGPGITFQQTESSSEKITVVAYEFGVPVIVVYYESISSSVVMSSDM